MRIEPAEDPAMMQQHDPICHPGHLIQMLTGHQNRDSVFTGAHPQQLCRPCRDSRGGRQPEQDRPCREERKTFPLAIHDTAPCEITLRGAPAEFSGEIQQADPGTAGRSMSWSC
jgi:hypothetical protein